MPLGLRASLCGAALLLAGCGASAPLPPVVAPPQPNTPTAAQVKVSEAPGLLPYRLLVLAGPGVAEVEHFSVLYALAGSGWTVRVTGPDPAPRGRHGLPLAVDLPLEDVDLAEHDVLFVPGGAPADEASAALIRAFAREKHLATTRDGAALVAATGIKALRASDNEAVLVEGNQLTCARPGDLPGLIRALNMYAQDQLRQAQAQVDQANPP